MAARSILEIEMKDAAFKEFMALFEKYQQQVKKLPGAWNNVNNIVARGSRGFEDAGKKARNISDQVDRAQVSGKKLFTVMQSTSRLMGTMARNTASIARNILSATGSLLKWAGLSSLFTGLLGAGGLYGIATLSDSASNIRRQAKGAGVTAGELQASSASFGKYVDAEAQLRQINDVRNDVSKRGALAAAGLNSPAMQAMSNADFQANALKIARNTFIRAGGTRQGAEAHGLLELFSFEELTRLKNTTEQEIDANVREYQTRKRLLEINDKTLHGWQDLTIQLDVAGRTISSVLIEKLAPLSGPLTKLSDAFAKALGSILGDSRMAGWIEDLGEAIQRFAKYLTSDEFSSDVKSFMKVIKDTGGALKEFGQFLNTIIHPLDAIVDAIVEVDRPKAKSSPGATGTWGNKGATGTWGNTSSLPGTPAALGTNPNPGGRNNPGNLRAWGSMPRSNGFAVFPSQEAGLHAMGKQLQLYGKRGNDTIAGIISKYAPSSENNTQAYIDDVARRTGYNPNTRLDLNDKQVLSKLMAAMTKHENNKTNYTPEQIRKVLDGTSTTTASKASPNSTVITVNNSTGGNAVVSFASMAH